MSFDVSFSKRADETFDSIGLQIQARFGAKEVKEFRKRVYKVVDTISNFPLIFQLVDHTDTILKAFIHKNCSMFYDIGTDHIEILFFWDNRQDPIFL